MCQQNSCKLYFVTFGAFVFAMFPCSRRGGLKIIANQSDAFHLLNERQLAFFCFSHICIDLSTVQSFRGNAGFKSVNTQAPPNCFAPGFSRSCLHALPLTLSEARFSLKLFRELEELEKLKHKTTVPDGDVLSSRCVQLLGSALFLSLTVIWPTLGEVCFPREVTQVSLGWGPSVCCAGGRELFCLWWVPRS